MKRILVWVVVLVALGSGAFAAETLALTTLLADTDLPGGTVMITIPAGVFIMGSNKGDLEEQPVHKVYLDTYQIGKCEVTVAQYRSFCKATGRTMPKAPPWGWKEDNPIVNVTWADAEAYCQWAGGRLPTEAEWEKAARGTDGRTYPWGNRWDEAKCTNGWAGSTTTAAVGSCQQGASPYGCLDMAGNVWEWCSDWYDENYYKVSPAKNPTGPTTGEFHVMRGGCYYNHWNATRCTYRGNFFPSGSWYSGGFRMAR